MGECRKTFPNPTQAKYHLITHYLAGFGYLAGSLHCPECQYEARDGATLRRHVAFGHNRMLAVSGCSAGELAACHQRQLVPIGEEAVDLTDCVE